MEYLDEKLSCWDCGEKGLNVAFFTWLLIWFGCDADLLNDFHSWK